MGNLNGNIVNGGLVTKKNDGIIFTDMYEYSGIFCIEERQKFKISDGIGWFMNLDDQDIYYSNQKDGDKLYKLNLIENREEVIVNDPVSQICIQDDRLYYINDKDGFLYYAKEDGTSIIKITDHDQCFSYCLTREGVIYSTSEGTYLLDNQNDKVKINDSNMMEMQINNNLIFYVDKSQKNINTYSLLDEKVNALNACHSSNLNNVGDYLFYINRDDGASIYRMKIDGSSVIKFWSERSDYLHVIDNQLVFCNIDRMREWYTIPIDGGKAIELKTH